MTDNIARGIIDAIVSEKTEYAQELFNLAMAQTVNSQIQDYKFQVAQTMFENFNGPADFVPAKRNFQVHAVDHTGTPIQMNDSGYHPSTVLRNAVSKGHSVTKILDSNGEDVTHEARGGLHTFRESVEQIDEGIRSRPLHTHLPSGKPNPNHPRYAEHKAEYDAARAAQRALEKKASPQKTKETTAMMHAKMAALDYSDFTEADPYDVAANAYPALHQKGELINHLDTAFKKHYGSKFYQYFADAWHEHMMDRAFDAYHEPENKDKPASWAEHRKQVSQELKTRNPWGQPKNIYEDTITGTIDADLTQQKKEENAAEAAETARKKAPTINDVMSVLGNTVSVADTNVAQ